MFMSQKIKWSYCLTNNFLPELLGHLALSLWLSTSSAPSGPGNNKSSSQCSHLRISSSLPSKQQPAPHSWRHSRATGAWLCLKLPKLGTCCLEYSDIHCQRHFKVHGAEPILQSFVSYYFLTYYHSIFFKMIKQENL